MLQGVEAGEALGIGRLLTASAFLIFAFTLLPGMFGGRLGTLDAYVPAPAADSAGGSASASGRPLWMKNQYHEALDRARARNSRRPLGRRTFLPTWLGLRCHSASEHVHVDRTGHGSFLCL